jgi:hypothetical protein
MMRLSPCIRISVAAADRQRALELDPKVEARP